MNPISEKGHNQESHCLEIPAILRCANFRSNGISPNTNQAHSSQILKFFSSQVMASTILTVLEITQLLENKHPSSNSLRRKINSEEHIDISPQEQRRRGFSEKDDWNGETISVLWLRRQWKLQSLWVLKKRCRSILRSLRSPLPLLLL